MRLSRPKLSNRIDLCCLEFALTDRERLSQAIRILVHADFDILEAMPLRAALDEVFAKLTQAGQSQAETAQEMPRATTKGPQ